MIVAAIISIPKLILPPELNINQLAYSVDPACIFMAHNHKYYASFQVHYCVCVIRYIRSHLGNAI